MLRWPAPVDENLKILSEVGPDKIGILDMSKGTGDGDTLAYTCHAKQSGI